MVKELKNHSRGYIAIIALIVISGLVASVVISIGGAIQAKRQASRDLLNSTKSYYLAESGIEDAVYREIKSLNPPSGIPSLTLDGASITQTISTIDKTTTIISESNYLNNIRKLTTTFTITTSNVSFHYGVQVGLGGVSMTSGGTVNGNIYSDGTITGSSGALITGDAFVATGMNLDTNWGNYSSSRDFGKVSPDTTDIAMAFIPASSGDLSQVSFYIKDTNNSTNDGIIKLTAYNGGVPAATSLATAILDTSKITQTFGWVNYSFTSPYSVTKDIPYWIVLDVGSSNSKYFMIGKDPLNTEASKYGSYSAGPWTNESGGYAFKAWIGGAPTFLDGVTVRGNAHANSITDSKICGDAYYQTIDLTSSNFLAAPTAANCPPPLSLTPGTGYVSPDPAVAALPISDSNIAEWKAAASASGIVYSGTDSACSPKVDMTIGPAVLNCDFNPSAGAKVTIEGTLWVTGNVNLTSNAIVYLDSAYGGNSGEIIADGTIDTNSGTLICGSQGYLNTTECNPSNGSYILLLSTDSSSSAINITSGSSGAIFYAANGTANITSGANLKEVTAYALDLSSGATVTYETGLASAVFSTGPGAGWQLSSWNETE